MYNEQMEQLISAALADGVLTEKEKQILFKKAESLGIDLDEFEMVLDARLVELAKAEKVKAEASAPKSNKLGDVKKCPSCGAIVQSYQGVCSECGYAFEGMDANSAVKELSSLLRSADIFESENIINSFPIPIEKSALIAFISWLKPQALHIGEDDDLIDLSSAYMKKYEECILKAKISFSGDKDFLPFIQNFEKDKKKRQAKSIISIFKKKKTWVIISSIVVISFIVWLCIPKVSTNESKCTAAIQKELQKGNLDKANELFFSFRGGATKSPRSLGGYVASSLCSANLEKGNLQQAIAIGANEELFDYFLEQGEYARAWDFRGDSDDINRIVSAMCEKNKKADAIKFVNARLTITNRYCDSESVKRAKQEALKIINQY